jgi:hypothetical protein
MSRIFIRVVFAALLVGFTAQMAVTKVWREPYPGLFQPGFGGFGGQQGQPGTMATVPAPTVTATYADGSTATFSDRDVMARSKSAPAAVFRSAFAAAGPGSPRLRPLDPRTSAWLDARLTELGGGRRPTSAVIAWHQVTFDVATRRPVGTATTDTVSVSFAAQVAR